LTSCKGPLFLVLWLTPTVKARDRSTRLRVLNSQSPVMFPRRITWFWLPLILGACWLRPKPFHGSPDDRSDSVPPPLNADHLGSVTNEECEVSGGSRSGCGQAPSGNFCLEAPFAWGEPMAKPAPTSHVNEVSVPAKPDQRQTRIGVTSCFILTDRDSDDHWGTVLSSRKSE
jgi:hypothetical protein